jgi:signal transduction histidine kinase
LVLVLSRRYNYLLFHSLAEIFSIIIACGVFMVAWNTRRFHDSSFLVFIGIAFAFVGGLDLAHTLAYNGMGVFTHDRGTDPATQLWVCARFVQAGSLVTAPLLLTRRIRILPVFAVYTPICTALVLSITYWHVFPSCHDGVSLTPFKKAAELVICGMVLLAMSLLLRRKERFEPRVLSLLLWSMGLTIVQEVAFMIYGNVTDHANWTGHVLKIASFYFLYQAIVVTALNQPFDLLFRDLSKAKEAAEGASRAKDQFLAMLSHELRTPLTPVLLAIPLLDERSDLPDEVRQDLHLIRRNIEIEAHLIEDLLDLMRVTHGKLRLILQATDVHALVSSAVAICGRGSGPPTTVSLEAENHHVLGDPTRLQQVFWNLLSNAQKYTPATGTILVRSYNELDGSQRSDWVLEVTDTGAGIEADLLPRVFDPFEQGDVERGRKFGGMGLGLAISKALVEAHAGEVTAYSPGPGRGATFRVRLATVPVPG